MRPSLYGLATGLILGTIAMTASATDCRQVHRTYYAPTYHAPTYQAAIVQPYVAQTYLSVPYPTYYVTYASAADSSISERLLKLLESSTEDRVKQAYQLGIAKPSPMFGQGKPGEGNDFTQPFVGNPAPQKPGAHPGAAYLQRACIGCHSAANAVAKGKSFVIFDASGSLTLDAASAMKAMARVHGKTMPPSPLVAATDEENSQVIDFILGSTIAAKK